MKNEKAQAAQNVLRNYPVTTGIPLFKLEDREDYDKAIRAYASTNAVGARFLYLRYFLKKSFEEISAELGLSVGYLKNLHTVYLEEFYPFTTLIKPTA